MKPLSRLSLSIGMAGLCVAGMIAVAAAQDAAVTADNGQSLYQRVQAVTQQPGGYGSSQRGAAATTWWEPGSGETMPTAALYSNSDGLLGIAVDGAPLNTAGHPFFTALGSNGRACVSCHQPENGMSISAATLQQRWQQTGGADPVFAAVDGSNCPSLPQAQAASHSLLLNKGLFRVFLPWPAKAADGTSIHAEFKIELVRDPTGCNNDPVYGLHSAHPTISVFRRPRVVANLKYVVDEFGGVPNNAAIKTSLAVDPQTGRPLTMQLMADARAPTLRAQAADAVRNHEQGQAAPTAQQLDQIVDFESRVYSAQALSRDAGDLGTKDAPPGLGVDNLRKIGAGATQGAPVFQSFAVWKSADRPDVDSLLQASVARGENIFTNRSFAIHGATHLDGTDLGKDARGTCASCHSGSMTGIGPAGAGWMDIGTNNLPTADPSPDLPLFKIICDADKPAHPFLGRVILTHDPGRALITGKCADVGAITTQQIRGLASRAPYFANGSAKDLPALVDYYDRRFQIHLTAREKDDLVNFLSVL